MSSESEGRPPRVLIAVQDQAVRERLRALLDRSEMGLEVVDPDIDPLVEPPETGADLVVVRRSDVQPKDLKLVDAYTSERTRPGLIVVTEEGDEADRARLMAAGASTVLETSDSNREMLESISAIAGAENAGANRGPQAGGEDPDASLADFLSRSPRMQRFLDLVGRVVDTDSSLLLCGETGVGKERLARAIHNEGARAAKPFVSVNCGAIPEALLESELFGHEAGAFTGATGRKRGRFEQANGGTIFLDEIGEMPAHLQVKLLTVLQRRRVQRVGSEEAHPVDLRVMAATHRDVDGDVAAGRFREDLFYRLNVVRLDIPALRERPEDIPDLAGRFIAHFREALGRQEVESISNEALERMLAHQWPGNVRELVNAVEHAVVLCRGRTIEPSDLPDWVARPIAGTGVETSSAASRAPIHEWLRMPLREARQRIALDFEREYLEALLQQTEGRIGETAELAGITPRSLYAKMRSHDLRKEDFR